MRKWAFTLAVLLLGGCANLRSPDEAGDYVGTLKPILGESQYMEARLDDKRFVGAWSKSRCFTDACRGTFRNVARVYRRHVHRGQAVLVAADGARLECEWAGYRDRLDGACGLDDGRVFRLAAE